MSVDDDMGMIKKMVEPLAAKAGIFRGRVMSMVTKENVRDIFLAVGEKGIQDAAEAIIRIGMLPAPDVATDTRGRRAR